MDLSELLSMRDALIRARARGAQRVRINGEEVEYKSDAEMASALADLERRINVATSTARRRTFNPVTGSGWR